MINSAFPGHVLCAARDQNLDKYIFQERGKETFKAEGTTYMYRCLKDEKTSQMVENKNRRKADVAEACNNLYYVLNAVIHSMCRKRHKFCEGSNSRPRFCVLGAQ